MANIVLKTLKNQPSLLQTVLSFDGVPMGNYEITASIPVLNPKLNASQLQTPLKLS
jgi:hypothetical protein